MRTNGRKEADEHTMQRTFTLPSSPRDIVAEKEKIIADTNTFIDNNDARGAHLFRGNS